MQDPISQYIDALEHANFMRVYRSFVVNIPKPPRYVARIAKVAPADRQGFEPFEYTERS